MTTVLRDEALGYWQRIRQFSPNARKLIISNSIRNFGGGVNMTIFNLYLLSLGFSNTFLSDVLSFNALSMAFGSLAMGYLINRIGTKKSLLISGSITGIVAIPQVFLPLPTIILFCAILLGLGNAMMFTCFGPFMAEQSAPYERTHLFGTSQSFGILTSFIGNTFAGYFPSWLSITLNLPIDSAPSFQLALTAWFIPLLVGILPILFVRELKTGKELEEISTKEKLKVEPKGRKIVILQFVLFSATVGLGAGFVIPFLNVFFWEFYKLPTPIVGFVQGLGSLSVAVGVFLSPVLSNRIGKAKTVVVCQALSLPFLFLIAVIINPFVAIIAYIFRVVLMNAATPVDRTLRMELVPERWRAYMSAFGGFGWNFPWAISTRITGPLFDQNLYLLPFWFTLTSYLASTTMYAIFFWSAEKRLARELDQNQQNENEILRYNTSRRGEFMQ